MNRGAVDPATMRLVPAPGPRSAVLPASPLPAGLRAVLFDLDDTLIHTGIDFPRMRREVLDEAAAAGVTPEALRGHEILRMVALAEQGGADAGFRARCEVRLTAIEMEAAAGARLAAGAVETLAWLHQRGLRIGIVTRNSPSVVRMLLERFPLPHQALFTRADTPRVKPDPLHLHVALGKLETAPEAAVMVGDHLMDMQAGHAAGTATVGLLLPTRPANYFDEVSPHAVIRALPELCALVGPA